MTNVAAGMIMCCLMFQVCHDSCEAQAWSVASVLEVLYDVEDVLATSTT